MQLLQPIAFALLLVSPAASAPQEETWTPLRLPALCVPRPDVARPAPLRDGRHIVLPAGRGRGEATTSGGVLPVGMLTQMLDELVRGNELGVEIHRAAPPVLVRGDAPAIALLERAVAELDAVAGALEIELEVVLRAERSTAAAPPAAGPADVVRRTSTVLSGDPAFFGERRATAFVGDYLVEVATDSGAAAPVPGLVHHGRTVALTAYRVRRGAAVHVHGVLDLADLEELAEFDPQTGDLGTFQLPQVNAAQISFAGTVASGGSLRVGLTGSGLDQADWTLWITPRTTADPEAGAAVGWGALDLALLADRPPTLTRALPGAGLEHVTTGRELVPEVEPLPPAALAAEIESRLNRRRQRSGDDLDLSVRAAGGLLLLPHSTPAAWAEARALVDALEAVRLDGGRVLVRHGGLEVDLPVSPGVPARVLVGSERTLVVDYDIEIASETWMPSPRVQPVFDGLCVELLPERERASAACWIATSAETRDLARATSTLARVQLVARGFRADRALFQPGAGARTVLPALQGSPALGLEYRK